MAVRPWQIRASALDGAAMVPDARRLSAQCWSLAPVVLKDYRLTSFMVRLSDGFRKPSGLLSFRTGLRFTRSASAVCSKRPPHRHAA